MNFPGAGIFWTTVGVVVGTLSLATLIGRAWAELLPSRFRGLARFYLAPAMGLATLTVFASVVGRIMALGDSALLPILVVAGLIWALLREKKTGDALAQALLISVFGLICGVSLFGALFVFGAFNVGNDAFTYLAHGNWLQQHAFGETITDALVSPLETQVLLYQRGGFRMGGSFLLALMQALLNLRWSTEVYPGVIIAAIAACCISIGFPIARWLRVVPRLGRLGLLAFPAFSAGGLIFGANQGFLPQTFGLSFGSAFLFLIGPLFQWVAIAQKNQLLDKGIFLKSALPAVLLLSAAILSYSEFAPFLVVAALGSSLLLIIKCRQWRALTGFVFLLLLLTAIVLNFELVRAYNALKLQSGVVVGAPADWNLPGFVAHAMGVHGGVWDYFQWSLSGHGASISSLIGISLVAMGCLAVIAGKKAIRSSTVSGDLLPVIVILALFASGFFYFRYLVPSPFASGKGQSWNQFKLAEWAHPFVMAILVLATVNLKPRFNSQFNRLVIGLLIIGVAGTSYISVLRIMPFMNSYSGIKDINQFYLNFRDTVYKVCPSNASIYLALEGPNHKFRQMAMLYLPDRNIKANWSDDGYIAPYLLVERRMNNPEKDDCIVEPTGLETLAKRGTAIGPFQVGTLNDLPQIRVVSVVNSHNRESDGTSWWYWVENKIGFKLQSISVSEKATQTKLEFQYETRTTQNLKVNIVKMDGSVKTFILNGKKNLLTKFEQLIDEPVKLIAEIHIETDAVATPLGKNDVRLAAWIIRNVQLTPMQP